VTRDVCKIEKGKNDIYVEERNKHSMADTSTQSSPNKEPMLAVEIVPLEEEEDDFDTLAVVEQVRAGIQRDLVQLKDYVVSSLPTDERGLDIIVLITMVATSIAASKDIMTSIFNMISAALELLAKRRNVQEVEIIANGKILILRDLSKKTAKELIESFEAQHSGMTTKLTPGTNLKVKAKVSKKNRTNK